MSNQKLKFTIKLFSAVIITLGLSISLQSLLAQWSAPQLSPPNANVAAPINTGSEDQTKTGSFTTNKGIYVGQDLTVMGEVNHSVENSFYINSYDSLQLRFNSGGLETSGVFGINNQANNRVLTILNNGNVGINTDNPQEKLHVAGSLRIGDYGGIGLTDGNGRISLYSSAFTNTYLQKEAVSRITLHTDGIKFFTAPAGVSGGAVSWSQKMRISNDGNVGIGVLNPVTAKLEVDGKILAHTPEDTDSDNTVATKGYVKYVDAQSGGGYMNWNDCEYKAVGTHRWGQTVTCSSGYQMVSWSGSCSGNYPNYTDTQECAIYPTGINSVYFYSACYGSYVYCNNATGGIKCCRYVAP